MVEMLEQQAGLRVHSEVQAGKPDKMADTQKRVVAGKMDERR